MRFLKSKIWGPTTVMVTLLLCIGGTFVIWSWLQDGPSASSESNSTTIRNISLVVGGVAAFVFTMWRTVVAERQSDAAQRQSEAALQQAETAHQSLLNERFQRSAEMLGSNDLSVRIGGIYALKQLAKDSPERFHVEIMRVFTAFVRLPTVDQGIEIVTEGDVGQDDQMRRVRADVEAVMQAIGYRSSKGIALEQNEKPSVLYLRDAVLNHLEVDHANFSSGWLTNVDLSDAKLPHAILSGARLRLANLKGANLTQANLSGAKLWGADMEEAVLSDANLSGADFRGRGSRSRRPTGPARGLTKKQLDEAFADSRDPPKLDGVIDAQTGEPLVWHGRSAPASVD